MTATDNVASSAARSGTATTGTATTGTATTGTATTGTATTAATVSPSRLARVPVPAAGVIAAVAGAALLYGYGAVARAIAGPMQAGDIGASHADPITPASFSIGVVLCTVVGTVLALVLARRAAAPARVFLRTAVVLTVVSLVFPLTATHTDTATRLTLALGHLVAAALIIPVLVSSLSGLSYRR
jgi:heme/copper-type cytochrome/quinol oxidase subunit 4